MTNPKDALSFRDWVTGSRPRTLPLAVAPVILGSASAWWRDSFDVFLVMLALVVAVALQIGVNFANDYSDGIRGTDDYRVGPARLTGSGRRAPAQVKRAAMVSFGLAVVAGVTLVVVSQSWWLMLIGVVALWAAWTYTGGKTPYGYRGLGEIVVFVYFGLVATIGTAHVQLGQVPWESWLTGSATGFFASAVLLLNNLRDVDQDRKAGKRTLAVLIGTTASKVAITLMLLAPYVIVGVLSLLFVWGPAVFATALLSAAVAFVVWTGKTPKDLILALQLTTVNSLLYAMGLGLAIAL